MLAEGINGKGSAVLESPDYTPEELMHEFFHPTGSTESDEGGQSEEDPKAQLQADEDEGDGSQTQVQAAKTGIKIGKVKVDGEELDVGEIDEAKNLDLVRKGLTFDRRMSDVGKERTALNKERAELEKLRSELSSTESQALLHDLRAIKELRDGQPEAYHSLLAKAKGTPAEPGKSPTDSADAILDKLVEENASYPVVKLLAEQLKATRSELRNIRNDVQKDIGDVKETATTLKKERETRVQAEAAATQQKELDATRQHLLDAGVTLEQIKAKAGLFAKVYTPSMTFKEVANMVYAHEIATAKPATPTTELETEEGDIDSMRPGTLPKAAATTKGGKPVSDKYKAMSLEMFGRVPTQHF